VDTVAASDRRSYAASLLRRLRAIRWGLTAGLL